MQDVEFRTGVAGFYILKSAFEFNCPTVSAIPPDFDPYREWLEIEPFEQPVDYYRLLGLARFEADVRRIQQAADERMALVRSYQMGPRGSYTQTLLNELAAARVCLLTAAAKAAYDAELTQRWMELDAAQRAMPEPPPVATQQAAMDGADDGLAEPTKFCWQTIVLIMATCLAVLLAAGGWLLSRPRSGSPPPTAQSEKQKGPPAPTRDQPPVSRRPAAILAAASGEIDFPVATAMLRGDVRLETVKGDNRLTDWTASDDAAEWGFRLERPGYLRVELGYATTGVGGERELVVQVDQRAKVCPLQASGGLGQFVTDTFTVAVPSSGLHTLTIRPGEHPRGNWLVLKSVRFIPVGTTVTP
jgi:hypothetical protein